MPLKAPSVRFHHGVFGVQSSTAWDPGCLCNLEINDLCFWNFLLSCFWQTPSVCFLHLLSRIPISQVECLVLSVMTFSFPSSPGCCHSGTGPVLLLPPPKRWNHSCAGHHAQVCAVLGTQLRNSCTLGKHSAS